MYFTALIPCHFYGSPKVTIGLLLEMNTGSFIPLLHFKSDHQISPLYCLVYQTLTSFRFVQSVLIPQLLFLPQWQIVFVNFSKYLACQSPLSGQSKL